MKKGTRVWTCDVCSKRETWRKGWRYFPNIPSDKNKHATLIYPWAVCSPQCEDATYDVWRAQAKLPG